MFEPFLAKLGPLGTAVVFVVLVMVAAAPGVWDVTSRLVATEPRRGGLWERARAVVRATAQAVREPSTVAGLRGVLWAAMARAR